MRFYAKKLHKLRECSVLIQYHTQELVEHEGFPITMLVSDYVEGELLAEFLKRQPGRRMGWFQGLHLLHGLAAGIEAIHDMGEYHGDLHDENIIINRRGIGFEIKLLDMFHWGGPARAPSAPTCATWCGCSTTPSAASAATPSIRPRSRTCAAG